MTASKITEQAIDYLTEKGHEVWRQNNHATRGRRFVGRKGVSDIIGICPKGKWVACEVKAPGDVLSGDQHAFLTSVRRRGGHAFLACVVGGKVQVLPY